MQYGALQTVLGAISGVTVTMTAILEKLAVAQLLNKISAFMENEISFPCSKDSAKPNTRHHVTLSGFITLDKF